MKRINGNWEILACGNDGLKDTKSLVKAGMSEKTASIIVKKLAEGIPEKKDIDQSNPLFGKSIVMTGFRDTALQEAIKNVGAKLGSSVSSKTFVVLVKDKEEDTGKANEARKLSVPLMTPEEFTIKYL
jgi:NAD-dependent DNA ligase